MDIRTFLQSSYKKDNFIQFISDRFYGFEENDTDYEEPYILAEQKHIQKYKFLGKVELDDAKELGFFEVVTTENTDIENNRVSLNNILKNKASDELLDGAIAIFHNPAKKEVWRLSFILFSYDDDNKEQVSNLKRYTFVLGKDIPSKTAYTQLKDLKYPKLDELQEAFSVEKISKEFFSKYKELYCQLVRDITVVNQNKITNKEKEILNDESVISFYIKKLLGRVVFLYFVQKKSWLNGNKKFLSELYKTHIKENPAIDFYDEIMEDLFFNALNTKRDNDKIILGTKEYTIPYLNGGLFESDKYDNENLTIPNEDFGKIIELFDSYNFTVIEDTPHESEIAIDPEMLGRVFEDLLEDRKEKGAFYTPREIVHYMSKKSIESYLETELKEHKYDFTIDEFLEKTTLDDEKVLEFYTNHPMKFLKIDNYFETLHPYKNLVVDFYIVAKLRGYLLNSDGTRSKKKKARSEINHNIWSKILKKEYEVVSVSFGSNKEIKLDKTYKYPTILKYIKIERNYFTLAFFPNINGDLELSTIFQVNKREIKRKLKNYYKALEEINENNFIFNNEVFIKVKELREDCRSLHAEPLSLFQVEELPRQAVAQVIQQGLSTFHNSFSKESITNEDLKKSLSRFNHYDKFINTLLSNSNTPQDHLRKLMIVVLNKIKVLDPAIGSGAFPMGILHEIVEARVHLGDKIPIGQMKRKVIENSIYGVDIEQSAVEIAKLRFWLSIVVDEDKPSPLPNLAYKIMVGNSLIETINGFDPLKLHGNKKEMKFLNEKFHRYFNSSDNDEKKQINEEIKRNVLTVLQSAFKTLDIQPKLEMNKKEQKEYEENREKYRLLKKISDDFSKNNYTDKLFLYKIYFKEVLENGGFDVVIGNPPYIKEYTNKSAFDGVRNLECYQGKMDLWYLFGCKGIDLLKDNGILSFIATNNWISNAGASKFRNKILNTSKIKEFIDFGDYKVFDSAGIQTMILITQKSLSSYIYQCDYSKIVNKNIDKRELVDFLNKKEDKRFSIFSSEVNSQELLNQNITFLESKISFILDKIEVNRNFELDKIKEVAQGIVTPNDNVTKKSLEILGKDYKLNEGIFNLNTQEKEDLNLSDDELELVKPLYTTNEISHYVASKKNTYWVIYTDSSFKDKAKIEQYSDLKKHLDRFQKVITSDNKPYGIHRARNEYFFKGTKVLALRKCVGRPLFSYVDFDSYVNQSFYIIKSDKINLKYLTALLNSKLVAFWLKYKGKMQGDNYQVDKEPILNIPIKKIEDTKPFEILVDFIIYLKENKKETYITEFFERVIDIAVYELYFKEELHLKDFGILETLKNELLPFDANFETIENTYKKFSDKNHTVAYNINFIDMLDIIKTVENK